MTGEISDGPVKSFMRQRQLERNARFIDHPLPPRDSVGDFLDVVISQPLVQSGQRRYILLHDLVSRHFEHGVLGFAQYVIIIELRLAKASFQSARKIIWAFEETSEPYRSSVTL